MIQSNLLIGTLQRYLRLKGITYKDLAEKLGQTEANMKRIFSKKTLSLHQLEKMCEVSGVELFELVKMAHPQRTGEADVFTLEQEKALAADAKLFGVLYLLLRGTSEKAILQKSVLSKQDIERAFFKLDKLGLIRLREGGRIKLLISKNVRWLLPGPLSELYTERIKGEFLDSTFSEENEKLRFMNANLSAESIRLFSRRLDKLMAEFSELAEMDKNEDSNGIQRVGFLVGYRPWQFSVIKGLMK